MIGIDLIAFVVPVMLLLLGVYVVRQARRSREAELTYRLRKCEIALHDAEQALDNTVRYYKMELGRLNQRRGDPVTDRPLRNRNNGRNGKDAGVSEDRNAQDLKFRRAKNAFARLYHPDRVAGDPAEKRMRVELFKEFWDELERIDRRTP